MTLLQLVSRRLQPRTNAPTEAWRRTRLWLRHTNNTTTLNHLYLHSRPRRSRNLLLLLPVYAALLESRCCRSCISSCHSNSPILSIQPRPQIPTYTHTHTHTSVKADCLAAVTHRRRNFLVPASRTSSLSKLVCRDFVLALRLVRKTQRQTRHALKLWKHARSESTAVANLPIVSHLFFARPRPTAVSFLNLDPPCRDFQLSPSSLAVPSACTRIQSLGGDPALQPCRPSRTSGPCSSKRPIRVPPIAEGLPVSLPVSPLVHVQPDPRVQLQVEDVSFWTHFPHANTW